MIHTLCVEERLQSEAVARWCRQGGVNHILIVSSQLVRDDLLTLAVKLRLPTGIPVAVKDYSDAAALLRDPYYSTLGIMVLLEHPAQAVRLLKDFPETAAVRIGRFADTAGAREHLVTIADLRPDAEIEQGSGPALLLKDFLLYDTAQTGRSS